MSPLLFALAIEPLAEAIRAEPSIEGLQTNEKHKLALYADDVLIFISNPDSSVPSLLNIINTFCTFSGYKIKLSKSEAMPVGSMKTIPDISPHFHLSGPLEDLYTWVFL